MISLPAQNPLFFSHPSLDVEFNRHLLETTSDTDWLWRDLVISKDTEHDDHIRFQKEWNRLLYHGLAEFFNEIAYYLAYLEALASIPEAKPKTRLFHGSNVALRMAACWDRIGFFLYERFQGPIPSKVYFNEAAKEMLKNDRVDVSFKPPILEMMKLYDEDTSLRNWRHEYIHRHGEYFGIDKSEAGITSEYFPLDQNSQDELSQKLVGILLKSFPRLKLAMELASTLVD